MSTPNESPNVSETPIFDPFPEPSGYPVGWDLSGINLESEPGLVATTENDSEA